MEIHGMTAQEINHEEDHNDDDANQKDIDSEEETDLESSDSENESIYDDQVSCSVTIVAKSFLFKGILMLT